VQKKRNRKGVTVVEYAIVLALNAIAVAVAAQVSPARLSVYLAKRPRNQGGAVMFKFAITPKESALAFPIHNNLVNNRALQNKCFEQDFTNRLGSQNPFL